MTLLDSLLSAQTGLGVALAIGIWVLSKFIDLILERALGTRLIKPIKNTILIKARSFFTRIDPIQANFKFTYTPESDLTTNQLKREIAEAFSTLEKETGHRVSYEEIKWNTVKGKTSATHENSSNHYDVRIRLKRNQEDEINNPEKEPSEYKIQEVNFDVGFSFAYPHLEAELPNLGLFVSKLSDALDQHLRGSSGPAKIELLPLSSELSLDDWIERDDFEVSLRLTGQDREPAKTEVEFYSDHVALYPPYYEMDGEIIGYVKTLVKNYYLTKRDSNRPLSLRGRTEN